MARPLDKCPVCGGEMIEKEVEKVLRGGGLTETLKIQAAVCLQCGERLYTPEAIKRFEQIRSTLEAKGGANAKDTTLQAKLDYEVWFLDFLEKHDDRFPGKDNPPEVELTSGDNSCQITIVSEEQLSSFYSAAVITTIMPLTFVASFKVLDMIFEWMLEENCTLGKIQTVPWRFTEKVKLLKNGSHLQLPPLFENQPCLYTYVKALFCQLLPYRNEVIDKNGFSVSEDALTLSSSKQGTSLTLSGEQVACLARFVRLLVRALLGEIVLDDYKTRMVRHYLDTLAPAHGLATFDQQMPRFVHVRLTVSRQGAGFPADLKQVRDRLESTFPAQAVIFDLNVRAVDGRKLMATWHFAPEEVPDLDVMTLYGESHKAHRVALVDRRSEGAGQQRNL